MEIIIQTPGFKATKKLEKFIDRHLQKLEVMNGEIIEADVCLKTDPSDTNENKICEMRLVISGKDLFAAKQTETFEESVAKAVRALKHQVARLKTLREKQRTVNG